MKAKSFCPHPPRRIQASIAVNTLEMHTNRVGAWSDLNLSFCTVMMRKVPQQQEVAPDHVLVALKFVHGEHHRCIWRRSNTENLRTEVKKKHILPQVNIWTLGVLTY